MSDLYRPPEKQTASDDLESAMREFNSCLSHALSCEGLELDECDL